MSIIFPNVYLSSLKEWEWLQFLCMLRCACLTLNHIILCEIQNKLNHSGLICLRVITKSIHTVDDKSHLYKTYNRHSIRDRLLMMKKAFKSCFYVMTLMLDSNRLYLTNKPCLTNHSVPLNALLLFLSTLWYKTYCLSVLNRRMILTLFL